ncbi:hypothetical protein [Bdellovibrio bacteriovorus]|uniref:hypothetical protein n=1 Tax=Bdellovibrio bacteriovorus TaxID=959 RepID=UPI0035A6A76D
MKKLVLISILGAATTAAAQQASYHYSAAEGLKQARVQMEKETELKLLEALEQQRLQEERNRMKTVETLNFNMVAEPTSVPAPAAVITTTEPATF